MARQQTITVLLYEGVNALDVAGPLEAFAAVRDDAGQPLYRVTTYALGQLQMRSASGLLLCADEPAPFQAPPGNLLLIPGGAGVRAPATLSALADWIVRNHGAFQSVASICTGAYALAETGLVNGRTITTHWAHAIDLKRRYPKVTVRADALFIRDGRFLSSGGVTAGIDLALDLIDNDHGPSKATAVARQLVVFLRRTGSQAQFSEPLKLQAKAGGALADVCHWAANHLDADLSVDALAARANLSARHFARLFRDTFGAPPADYVRRLRVEAARQALVFDGAGLDQIAHACGFDSADGLRRAFQRAFDVTPNEYRRRFGRRGENA
jgi:transcriptional regulator GlxA family with amidase domain